MTPEEQEATRADAGTGGVGAPRPEFLPEHKAPAIARATDEKRAVADPYLARYAQEAAELEAWAERFDTKLDELTARQDAFLKYLEIQAHSA